MDDPIDVARLIDQATWTRYQQWLLYLAALALGMEGLAAQSMGPALPVLARTWHVNRASFAPAAALGLLGFAFGAATAGAVADRFGRRWTLVASLILLGAATIGCGLSNDVATFGAWRVLAGLGLGGTIPVATALIADFTPARRRNLAIAVAITLLPLGGFVAGLIAAFTLGRHEWRWLFFTVGGIPVVFAAILALVLPESPQFLARSPARRDRLFAVLARMGLKPASDAVFVDAAGPGSARLSALFAQGRGRDTLALWAAFFALVLGMYSFFSWGPEALRSRGFPITLAAGALSAFAIGGVAGNLFSGWLMDRFGSRVSIAVQMALGVIAGAALAATNARFGGGADAALAAIFLLGASFSGGQTMLYALATHLYPPAARSTGLGAAVAWGRIGAIVSSYTGVLSLDAGGPPAYFAGIALAAAVTAAFSLAVGAQLSRAARASS